MLATFYYTQTVTYFLTVEADSEEAADAIAEQTDVQAAGVQASYEGWEEDGCSE